MNRKEVIKVTEQEVEEKGRHEIVAEFCESQLHPYWYVTSVNFDSFTDEYIIVFQEMTVIQRLDYKTMGYIISDSLWY